MSPGEESVVQDGVLHVRLVEYQSLRAEVHSRTQAQLALLTLNVTAAGVVGSVALSGAGNRALVLVLPYLSAALSMTWLDHARSITNSMAYCHRLLDHLYTDVVGPYAPAGLARSYEHHLRERSTEGTRRHTLSIAGPYSAIFNLPALIALAAAWTALRSHPLLLTVWGIGALMTLMSVIWWLRIKFISTDERAAA